MWIQGVDEYGRICKSEILKRYVLMLKALYQKHQKLSPRDAVLLGTLSKNNCRVYPQDEKAVIEIPRFIPKIIADTSIFSSVMLVPVGLHLLDQNGWKHLSYAPDGQFILNCQYGNSPNDNLQNFLLNILALDTSIKHKTKVVGEKTKLISIGEQEKVKFRYQMVELKANLKKMIGKCDLIPANEFGFKDVKQGRMFLRLGRNSRVAVSFQLHKL